VLNVILLIEKLQFFIISGFSFFQFIVFLLYDAFFIFYEFLLFLNLVVHTESLFLFIVLVLAHMFLELIFQSLDSEYFCLLILQLVLGSF
jgi:hypothetical protein